ncbi:hypothetical protein I601_3709 [Nocardioides dokdonensis FR1436]|uniref:Uncharacterized protein n=1 Tax=Nocardioides dokdonensis FR1436 TaxID=1300347 RepID=A0A1A9GP84_9ACTN|nr:hypothetical protein I601_3709 [Nocardioides dokdonensis FR1436]
MTGVATVPGSGPVDQDGGVLPHHLQANLDENPWAGQGSVLLDIGGDVGALVVDMPIALVGHEVEIDPADGRDHPPHQHSHEHSHEHGHGHGHPHRAHVAVVPRRTPGGTRPSVVFPDLVEGGYRLYHPGTEDVALTVQVRGGEVTSATWPT